MKFAWKSQMSWPEFWGLLLFGILVCIVVLASNYGATVLARWLGYQGQLGGFVSASIFIVICNGVIVRRLYPEQGRSVVYRGLSGTLFLIAVCGISTAMVLIPRSQWTTRSIWLYALLAITLILQLIWVARRFPPPNWKPPGNGTH